MCKQILPIENFALCDRYGGRRGKCKPCETEHKQRSKGTWEEYQKELNDFGGHYKNRWGDLETIGLFCYTHFEKNPYNFDLKKDGYYDDKFPTFLSSYAPGVDKSLNAHNFFLLRWYHSIKILIKKVLFNYKIEEDTKS